MRGVKVTILFWLLLSFDIIVVSKVLRFYSFVLTPASILYPKDKTKKERKKDKEKLR